MKRRITAAVLSVSAAFLALLPTNASAATYTNCPSGSRCLQLYYNSAWSGSHTAFTSSVSDFAGYTFLSSGNGQGQTVKNNAASASLLTYPANDVNAAIFFYSGYGGACDFLYGYGDGSYNDVKQLGPTYNENASFYFTGSGPTTNCAVWR
ncbi:hypothetical protein [Streptomyces chromofuscus]|uniref:Peptidase inhibitor family I36 n=1 Tax=Streptomyces chromofuscus TaxID=42881 RepID=A0A7M2T0K4_STRCW|nr:hypothetical protein [Streptomyces chromofuscus]QOV41864.1 hypothetical protein IPT68_18350 [Streptomyces chromofuscus]GGS87751.1 hypothetical protein GCM10010254_04490 [Streptomyces chromofuscus]